MPENASCSSASTCGRSSCEGCPSKEKTSMLEEMNPHSNIKHVIGVVSGKGGVGNHPVAVGDHIGSGEGGGAEQQDAEDGQREGSHAYGKLAV